MGCNYSASSLPPGNWDQIDEIHVREGKAISRGHRLLPGSICLRLLVCRPGQEERPRADLVWEVAGADEGWSRAVETNKQRPNQEIQ